MSSHKNAKLTPLGRVELIRRLQAGESPGAVATALGLDPSTVHKWRRRYRAEGKAGLQDRSSRPARSPTRTLERDAQRVITLRRERRTYEQIAHATGLSRATVGRILQRAGLNRLSALDPRPPVVRYERATAGEMLHVDIKKLGRFERIGHRITGDRKGQSNSRGVGWDFVHVAIDDASRIAFAQIFPDEMKHSAAAFLRAAVAYYATLGVRVERVMTDNGSCYRSTLWRATCLKLGIKHIRTKPYTPRTNGKAERFIQSALREWAYAQAYEQSEQRNDELPTWLHRYNWHRPHAGIGGTVPISRLRLADDNLLRLHI